jgi:hypothetical protein
MKYLVYKLVTIAIVMFQLEIFAQVNFTESQIIFSETQLGDTATEIIILKNYTNKPFKFDSIIVINANGYVISNIGEGIEPNEEINIEIKFIPTHNITYRSHLIVTVENGSMAMIELLGNGKTPLDYYQSTFNLFEKELFDELRKITGQGYVNLGYNTARDRMYGEIDNHDGFITCVYTGRKAQFNTRAGANTNSMNTEHTWPQSFFNRREPERADLHHIFPCDVNANNVRANYPFANVSNPTWTEGGSKLSNQLFEPRNEHKGLLSRSMLYFIIRYSNTGNFWGNQEQYFKKWNKDFMPDSLEILRNDNIFKYQKNRNPFSDHPEFVERISNFANPQARVLFQEIYSTSDEVKYSQADLNQQYSSFYLINKGNTPLSNVTTSGLEQWFTQIDIADYYIKIKFDSTVLIHQSFIDSLVINYGVDQKYVLKVHYNHDSTAQLDQIYLPFKLYFQNYSQHIIWEGLPQSTTSITVIGTDGSILIKDKTIHNYLNISNLTNGLYFVEIRQNGHSFYQKVPIFR